MHSRVGAEGLACQGRPVPAFSPEAAAAPAVSRWPRQGASGAVVPSRSEAASPFLTRLGICHQAAVTFSSGLFTPQALEMHVPHPQILREIADSM